MFEKRGLTPSERRWFVGGDREWPRSFGLDGWRFGVPLLQVNCRRPDNDPPGQNLVVLGGSLAVAAAGTLLYPFEPLLITLEALRSTRRR